MRTQSEYDKVVQEYSNMIFRIAFNWLKDIDNANDVVQDVMIQAYLTEKEFESKDHLKNWLVRVTINQCKKFFRSPWQRRENIDDYLNTLTVEEPEYRELLQAILHLDKKYSVPIVLFYFYGYSTREIAGFLKISENTVSTRLRRGKAQLAEYLKEE